MLEEITSGVHGFAERAFEDWAPVQLIATADKPLELLWANEYSVFLPQTLAIVDRAALEAHNARLAELEGQREVTERMLIALRAEVRRLQTEVASPRTPQTWEPVPMHSWDEPDADYGLRTASISDDRLYIETESDTLSIGLPSDYRLCRLVSQESSQ